MFKPGFKPITTKFRTLSLALSAFLHLGDVALRSKVGITPRMYSIKNEKNFKKQKNLKTRHKKGEKCARWLNGLGGKTRQRAEPWKCISIEEKKGRASGPLNTAFMSCLADKNLI